MTTIAEYLDPTDVTTPIGSTPIPGLRDWLGTDASEDVKLVAWYSAAINWVNKKLSERDFVDSGGSDINPPDDVVLGVYEHVRGQKALAEAENPLAMRIQTGQRQEDYDALRTAMELAGSKAWPYIEPYVENALLLCSGGL